MNLFLNSFFWCYWSQPYVLEVWTCFLRSLHLKTPEAHPYYTHYHAIYYQVPWMLISIVVITWLSCSYNVSLIPLLKNVFSSLWYGIYFVGQCITHNAYGVNNWKISILILGLLIIENSDVLINNFSTNPNLSNLFLI